MGEEAENENFNSPIDRQIEADMRYLESISAGEFVRKRTREDKPGKNTQSWEKFDEKKLQKMVDASIAAKPDERLLNMLFMDNMPFFMEIGLSPKRIFLEYVMKRPAFVEILKKAGFINQDGTPNERINQAVYAKRTELSYAPTLAVKQRNSGGN